MKLKLPNVKMNNQQMLTVAAVSIAVCAALALYAFRGAIFLGGKEDAGEAVPVSDLSAPSFRHPLTGAPVESEVEPPHVFGVMVENMVDSWPQSGLEDAFLVIEAPVEAAIPRFIAFFSEEQNVEKIGPVRSARPYYVDWANELNALYAHVGGSDAALGLISSNGTFDLNEFSFGQYFWRSADRVAPHNVYTSTELLGSALERRQEQEVAPEPEYGAWTFKADEPRRGEAPDVMVDFSTPAYRVTWTYDVSSNIYRRLQAGLPHDMQDGDAILANNVAVLVTAITVIDSIGRREVETIGEGEALILQDGRLIVGTWKKPSVHERLRFYGADGAEIRWNAGKTWIEVIQSKENAAVDGDGAASVF
jgi:hypothetical protein